MNPKIRFLHDLGYAQTQHDSHVPFLSHLTATRRLLQRWGARAVLCDAGLFHSVYGTQFFAPDAADVPPRSAVQDLIGADAEEIAWLWCAIERTSLDPDTGRVTLWRDRASTTLPARRVEDLATLWAADTVEQIGRLEPGERGAAHRARQLATRMMPRARTALENALAALETEV